MAWLTVSLQAMAAASPGPAWPLESSHLLCSCFFPHLPLQPHGHLAPPSCGPGGGGDLPDHGQCAQGAGLDCAGGDEPPTPADLLAQQVLRVLPACGSTQVIHSSLCTCLYKFMQRLRPLAPGSRHVALQVPVGLQSCHQWPCLPLPPSMVEPVQPLQRTPIGPWQRLGPHVHRLQTAAKRVSRDTGGDKLELAQCVTP